MTLNISETLTELLSRIDDFFEGFGIDFFSLVLGIILVLAIALLIRWSRGKKRETLAQPTASAAAPRSSSSRKSLRVVKPGVVPQKPMGPAEPVEMTTETAEVEPVEVAEPAETTFTLNEGEAEVRIHVTLTLPAHVTTTLKGSEPKQ